MAGSPWLGSRGFLGEQGGLLDASSVLVRPQTPFEGLQRVVEAVATLAPGPLLVTDLAGHEEEFPPTVREARAEHGHRLSEPVFAFHTSGSTGLPKCVIYRRSEVLAHARVVAEMLDLNAEITYVALPPPRFAYGLSIVNSHALVDVPVTFVNPQNELGSVEVNHGEELAIYALPQHAPLLLSSDLPAESVTRLLIAGGRLTQASAAALARRFPRMRLTNMYGQAEMGPRLAMWEGDPRDFSEGTIGRPIPGVELDVSADGELLARSDHAMTFGLNPPYADVEPFAGRHEPVRTGDLASRLPDGDFRHDGRGDHVLNVAGTKIDVRHIVSIVDAAARPLLVQVHSRPARTGDTIPVVEIVTDGPPETDAITIRRALHAEIGSLAALFDIRFVDTPTVKESGK